MADRIAVMREGAIIQESSPAELYFHPASAFVAAFFSQVNRVRSVVRGGAASTPFGPIAAAGLPEGTEVEVLIRPEALRLGSPATTEGGAIAKVIAARLLGRTSLIHLWAGEFGGVPQHLHSRMPGRFLPAEGELVAVSLDRTQAFVFPI